MDKGKGEGCNGCGPSMQPKQQQLTPAKTGHTKQSTHGRSMSQHHANTARKGSSKK